MKSLSILQIFLMMWTLSELHPTPIPSNFRSSRENESERLELEVRRAVNQSLINYNHTTNFTAELIRNLVQNIRRTEIDSGCCKPLSIEELEMQYLNDRDLIYSNCITLTRLTVPVGDTVENLSVLNITNSNCVEPGIQIHSECSPKHCNTVPRLDYLGPNYFPRLVLGVKCTGCGYDNFNDNDDACTNTTCRPREHSINYQLLKRIGCENGKEKWVPDKEGTVIAGCSCLPRRLMSS